MKNNTLNSLTLSLPVIGLILTIASLLASQSALAVPAFARQVGLGCSSCHYQDYPALNAFGRAFKQQAYTLSGQQNIEQGQTLSLPVTLNASLLTKIRYQKSNGSTSETDTGELQFPDEAALMIGGRAGNNIGFMLEFATFGQADTGSGTVTAGTADTGTGDFSLFSSYKAHFNYPRNGTNYGVVVFSTDAGGAPYGFELLNTGAQRFIRVAEDRKAISAQQFLELGAGEAEGLAFVASNDKGFINLSLWTPDHGAVAVNSFANYLRAVYTPVVRGWDTAVGIQYFGGTASRSMASGGDIDTDGWAVDGQLQGALGDTPVGFYFSYGVAESGSNNLFNTEINDKKAWSLIGEWGVIRDKATLLVGYLDGDNGTAGALGANEDRRFLVGATWLVAMNVELQIWNTSFSGNLYDPKPVSGGDNLTSLMLFAGF